jgi:hypothetical protein
MGYFNKDNNGRLVSWQFVEVGDYSRNKMRNSTNLLTYKKKADGYMYS